MNLEELKKEEKRIFLAHKKRKKAYYQKVKSKDKRLIMNLNLIVSIF